MEIYGNTYSVYSPAVALMEQTDEALLKKNSIMVLIFIAVRYCYGA